MVTMRPRVDIILTLQRAMIHLEKDLVTTKGKNNAVAFENLANVGSNNYLRVVIQVQI